MRHPYLIDLNNEENWLYPQVLMRPDGTPGEDQRTINIGEGPRRACCVTDSIMYPGGDAERIHFHEHHVGYECFFIDSGGMDLYIDSKKTFVGPGNIAFFQPFQAHGMTFREPTKFRCFEHDLKNSDTAHERALLRQKRPEITKDPNFRGKIFVGKFDMGAREAFDCVEVPPEQVSAVRNIAHPLETFQLEGVTMKMIIARWENAGYNEMWAAEMEPGFHAEWVEFPSENEMYYVTEGEIQFKVYDEEFTAYPECVVKIPMYASRSIKALKKSVMYDIGGLTRWQALLQDRTGILKDPVRSKDPEEMQNLKEKYGCQIKSYGL